MRAVAAVLAVLCATVHAAPGDELPVLGEVNGGRARIVVRGELSKARSRELVSLVSRVVADVERRFTSKHDPDAAVTLLLFSDAARYREVAREFREPLISDGGFYLPDKRVAIANVGSSVGNLRHELVHPLLGDDYPAIPSWLNEGIAALYGTAKATKQGFTFLVNYRLRDLQRALEADTLPTIAELATSSAAELYGERAMVFYALARYVLLYVDRHGDLAKLYADLRAAKLKDHAAILASHVDDKAFRAWARKLRR